MTMDWTGRRLDSIVNNGTTSSYLYDASGIRTRKTVGGTTTEYFTSGSTILAEKTGDTVLWFIYDSDGEILGFTYNGTPYYYIKNAQGDVMRIVDADGTNRATYSYDPWGKVLSATGSMAQINPIRYRSYYYDKETSLYYLQSRYYDPETGRFLNADGLFASGLTTANMFTYCNNNPVGLSDESGHFAYNKMLRMTDSGGLHLSKALAAHDSINLPSIIPSPKPIVQKTIKSIEAFYTSFEAYAGVGYGTFADASAGLAGVSLGAKEDMYCIVINDGKIDTGRQSSQTISCSFCYLESGYSSSKYHSFNHSSNCGCDFSKETITGTMSQCPDIVVSNSPSCCFTMGVGVYAILGGSVSTSFDVSEYVQKIYIIWSE